MKTLYGEFTNEQIIETQTKLRKQIFFLMVQLDPKVENKNEDVDVERAFTSLLYRLDGFNTLCNNPPELVTIMSLIQEALNIFKSDNFDFSIYRKLLLDAGSEVMNLKVGD